MLVAEPLVTIVVRASETTAVVVGVRAVVVGAVVVVVVRAVVVGLAVVVVVVVGLAVVVVVVVGLAVVVVVVRAVVVMVVMVVLGASVQLKTPNGAAAKSGMSPLHVSKFCTVIRTICASTTLENTQIGSSPLHVMPLHSLPFVLLHST